MSVFTLLLWWFRNGRPLIYFRFFRLPSHLRTLQFERSRMLQFLELLPFEMSHLPFCTEWAQTSLMKICSFLWTTTNETQVCIFLVLKCNLRSSWTFLISFNFQCLQVYNKFSIAEVLSRRYPLDLRITSRSSLTLGGGKKANQAKGTSYTCEWHAGRELETHKP